PIAGSTLDEIGLPSSVHPPARRGLDDLDGNCSGLYGAAHQPHQKRDQSHGPSSVDGSGTRRLDVNYNRRRTPTCRRSRAPKRGPLQTFFLGSTTGSWRRAPVTNGTGSSSGGGASKRAVSLRKSGSCAGEEWNGGARTEDSAARARGWDEQS